MAEEGVQFDNSSSRIRKSGDWGGWVRSQVAGVRSQVAGGRCQVSGRRGRVWIRGTFLFSGEAVENRKDREGVVLGVKEAANG